MYVFINKLIVTSKLLRRYVLAGVDGKILKWIFKKWDGAWTGYSWLRIGTGGGLL
jgi:hypothetical protein